MASDEYVIRINVIGSDVHSTPGTLVGGCLSFQSVFIGRQPRAPINAHPTAVAPGTT